MDIENNDEVKEVLKTMCGLGASIENRGIEKGRLIQLIELVQSGDLPVEKASHKADMSVEEFEQKMKEMSVIEGQ